MEINKHNDTGGLSFLPAFFPKTGQSGILLLENFSTFEKFFL